MFDHFLNLVDPSLGSRSGAVFYSGRSAFSQPSDIYILGLNPGGDPTDEQNDTVARNIVEARAREVDDWSAYCDQPWKRSPPGEHGMQPRVRHLLGKLGRDPRRVPASNVLFVRTARESGLARAETPALLATCWQVHQQVIDRLGVRTVLCFGGTAGRWVRKALNAHTPAGLYTEDNNRRWTSRAHSDPIGRHVVTLTHPSIADWCCPKTDPTSLVAEAIAASRLSPSPARAVRRPALVR